MEMDWEEEEAQPREMGRVLWAYGLASFLSRQRP
jgi:hypothetical protein